MELWKKTEFEFAGIINQQIIQNQNGLLSYCYLCKGQRLLIVEEEIMLLLLIVFPNWAPVQQLGHLRQGSKNNVQTFRLWFFLSSHIVSAAKNRPGHHTRGNAASPSMLSPPEAGERMSQDFKGLSSHLGLAGGGIRNVVKSWVKDIEEIFHKTTRERLTDQAVMVEVKHPGDRKMSIRN